MSSLLSVDLGEPRSGLDCSSCSRVIKNYHHAEEESVLQFSLDHPSDEHLDSIEFSLPFKDYENAFAKILQRIYKYYSELGVVEASDVAYIDRLVILP